MSSTMHMAPNLAPRTIPPLAATIKLKAINSVRVNYNLSPVNSVPPAQITLTPAVPSMGAMNYLSLQGYYSTLPGREWICLGIEPTDSLMLNFATVSGKTYLLDVGVHNTGNPVWHYQFKFGGAPQGSATSTVSTVTAVQGNLLIPFIAFAGKIMLLLYLGPGGQRSNFLSAELTRVD
ncbi:MAG: hypothetical protein ABSG32_01225 [Terriglobia bacterium]|jgi:hypothetical protein